MKKVLIFENQRYDIKNTFNFVNMALNFFLYLSYWVIINNL